METPNQTETTAPARQAMLTVDEVGKLLQVGPAEVRRLVRAGKFPEPIKFTRRIHRWSADAVDLAIAALTAAQTPNQAA
jgi:predicted DNA-binding transcriptional regulator AlpA